MSGILKAMVLCGAALIASQGAVAEDLNGEAADDKASSEVKLERLIHNGTGCKDRNSLRAALIDSDHDGFAERLRFNFTDYVAEQGPDVPRRDARKNCAIRLFLNQPSGWQLGITSVRFIGNAQLPAGVVGNLESSYGFPLQKATFRSTVAGPKDGAYKRGNALDHTEVVWSECGANSPLLGLNTQIFLTKDRTSTASVSTTGQVYWLQWRKCG